MRVHEFSFFPIIQVHLENTFKNFYWRVEENILVSAHALELYNGSRSHSATVANFSLLLLSNEQNLK